MTPKAWGNTELIIGGSNFEVHRIEVNKGGYCSMHKHASKYNMIKVEDGALNITMPEVATDRTCVVRRGQSITIPPGELHKFLAIEATVAYEFYWAVLDPDDIIRTDVGGIEQ